MLRLEYYFLCCLDIKCQIVCFARVRLSSCLCMLFGFFYHYSGLFKWMTVILSKVFWRIVNAMYSTLYINSLFRDYFEVSFSFYQVSWKLAWFLLLWFTCTEISKILWFFSPPSPTQAKETQIIAQEEMANVNWKIWRSLFFHN